MPHDIMSTMHETGMVGSHHWLFWLMIVAGLAVAFILVWQFSKRGKDSK